MIIWNGKLSVVVVLVEEWYCKMVCKGMFVEFFMELLLSGVDFDFEC